MQLPLAVAPSPQMAFVNFFLKNHYSLTAKLR
jgi:hypothetical protein